MGDGSILVRVSTEILAQMKNGAVEPVVILGVTEQPDGTYDMTLKTPDLVVENRKLRLAFCDEAYIVAAQTLDVKALGKGRRCILVEQAWRMARVGLRLGEPRHHGYLPTGIEERARELVVRLEAER